MTTQKKATLRTRPMTELLKYEFTTPEKLELGRRLADTHRKILDLEAEKKAASDRLKAQIEAVEQQVLTLASNLSHGFEYREIDCEEVMDFDSKTVRVVRLDTGEIVSERAMTAEERQMGFFEKQESDRPC